MTKTREREREFSTLSWNLSLVLFLTIAHYSQFKREASAVGLGAMICLSANSIAKSSDTAPTTMYAMPAYWLWSYKKTI